VIPPIQEKKMMGDEQEKAEEEEGHYELATSLFLHLFGGTTSSNLTLDRNASPDSSGSKATSPSRSSLNQPLMPVISTKPEATAVENATNDPSPQQNPKQPSPMQASPSNSSQMQSTSPSGTSTNQGKVTLPGSSSPRQPVTPVFSTKLITVAGESTTNTPSPQQNLKQHSSTQETQTALVVKPEIVGINKSESSGTNESEKGVMTRQKAVSKGKELKEVNKAEDPEAKAKLLRALACQKKEKEQQETTNGNEQDEGKFISNNSPQPKPSDIDPQVRSPVVTFKTEASVTTPMRSPSTKTSSSTPSNLTKSDSSEPKT